MELGVAMDKYKERKALTEKEKTTLVDRAHEFIGPLMAENDLDPTQKGFVYESEVNYTCDEAVRLAYLILEAAN